MPRARRLLDARLAAQLPPRGRKSAFVARRRATPRPGSRPGEMGFSCAVAACL